ncbi:hypothetical protein SAMN05192533_12321 [Mesobacillus persicus]|uniref:Uncharacterized protein n=1 Tax=Mesobacillus persicus TaxID=930146 RepID=A0A1H8JX53_9BACI|nr:CBO0543 family protein [Mesobacillus persicus]SEN85270.1 hypothetical protein SAMN05192533_12321 [Mesobacillus persicus]
MIKKSWQSYFLIITTIIGLCLLPFAIIKRPFKDWLIVYLVSIIGNAAADNYLVSKGYLSYPRKLFSRITSIHLPFDFIQYPLILLYYNQWTLNSKPAGVLFKLFPFLVPQILIETIAAKKTKLISWKNGWSWYHSMISLMIKMLVCRGIIALVRVINKDKVSLS